MPRPDGFDAPGAAAGVFFFTVAFVVLRGLAAGFFAAGFFAAGVLAAAAPFDGRTTDTTGGTGGEGFPAVTMLNPVSP